MRFPDPTEPLALTFWIIGAIILITAIAVALLRKPRKPVHSKKVRLPWWNKQRPSRLLVMVLFTSGAITGIYPTAAQWLTTKQLHESNQQHEQLVRADPKREEKLKAVAEYNSHLPQIAYDYARGDLAQGDDEAYRCYLDLISATPTTPIATLEIPRVGVDLPVFHGTDSWALSHGVGHMFGTALPTGGKGTHVGFAAHSGLAGHEFFTEVPKMVKGDTFDVHVLGEKLRYKVVEIKEVEPDATKVIEPEENRDLISLVTCVPIGVNSHRLIVTGERVPLSEDQQPLEMPDIPGFPWWILLVSPVIIGSTWYGVKPLYQPIKPKTQNSEKKEPTDV